MKKFAYLSLLVGFNAMNSYAASSLPFACTIKMKPEAVRAPENVTPKEAAYLETLNNPRVYQGPPESRAIKRIGFPFLSKTKLRADRFTFENGDQGLKLIHEGALMEYGGIGYREMTNMPLMTIRNPKTGEYQILMMPRAIRNYYTEVNLTAGGTISPKDYVSDVPVFVMTPKFDQNGKMTGKIKYINHAIMSKPEAGFLFEDPRLSVIYNRDGTSRTLLTGTDYSSHVPGNKNPDVMNRYTELEFDENGYPRPADVNGKIHFFDLSPPPARRADGSYSFIDAKNAVIALNELGELTVHTRFRPDFNDAEMIKLFRGKISKYAEQIFVFPGGIAEMQAYEWKYALEDLNDPKMAAGSKNRVRPKSAQTILVDKDLKELYNAEDTITEKGKGLGPGSAPYRLERHGNQLLVSRGKYAPSFPYKKALPANFPLKDGEVTYIAINHEVRYLKDMRNGMKSIKRHYSGSPVRYNNELTKIITYYSDAIQPKLALEVNSGTSGVGDLQHLYPMTGDIVPDESGFAHAIQPFGASDSHVEWAEVDFISMLIEMEDPARIASGQIRHFK
ncbi:MAG: hypothetical protein H7301_00845 [Cryobacterium sp.]|nr:hypothetical protein [Oligoflexia bacterium]